MSSRAPWRIILAAEGSSDLRRIQIIVDRLLEKHSDGAATLDELRRFEGLDGESYIKITSIPKLARDRGLSRYYSPDGPRKGDGGMLRQLFQVLQKEKLLAPRNVIIWARDDDGDPSRREDAEAAKDKLPKTAPLLLAIATECGEAWVLAGWRPAAADMKLRAWKRKLGFAPHLEPERLSHKKNLPGSAKAVLEDIFHGDQEQEREALILAVDPGGDASRDCGLHAFHVEIEAWLSQL